MMMGSVSWVSEGVCGSAGQGIIAAGMCGQTVLMLSDALSHLHPSIIQYRGCLTGGGYKTRNQH